MRTSKLLACLLLGFIPSVPCALVAQEAAPKKNADNKQPAAATEPAKTTDPVKTTDPAKTAADAKSVGEVYAAKIEEWTTLNQDIDVAISDLRVATEEKRPEAEKKYTELVIKANEMLPPLRAAAMAAYVDKPNEDKGLVRVLVGIAANDVRHDRYEEAYELAQLLIEKKCEAKATYSLAGVAAYALHDFEKAKQYLQTAKDADALRDLGGHSTFELEAYLKSADEYKDLWAKEQAIREKEQKDELPQVKLTTSHGDIVVELFENEAPQAVANFIHLVEDKYYDGLTFHRVLPGYMAQGGCPEGTGSGGPGYKIYCECDEKEFPNYRRHFRGTLSMAHAGPDTGGSQFFLTFLPTAHLNGRHTSFGRVISGLDVLAEIQRRDPSSKSPLPKPDQIVKAEVIRKKDHEYKPTKVEDPSTSKKDDEAPKKDDSSSKKNDAEPKKVDAESPQGKSDSKKDDSKS